MKLKIIQHGFEKEIEVSNISILKAFVYAKFFLFGLAVGAILIGVGLGMLINLII